MKQEREARNGVKVIQVMEGRIRREGQVIEHNMSDLPREGELTS